MCGINLKVSFLLVKWSIHNLVVWDLAYSSEHSMRKSSMLFECAPMFTPHPPDVIHMISVPKPLLFYATLPLLLIILNASQRTEAWEQG